MGAKVCVRVCVRAKSASARVSDMYPHLVNTPNSCTAKSASSVMFLAPENGHVIHVPRATRLERHRRAA
eukprot:7031159-Prymnesium_polylepis.1